MALLEVEQINHDEFPHQELSVSKGWDELVNELAPKPDDDAEVADPRTAIRYAVARCIIYKDEPITDEVINSNNKRTVKIALADIAGIPGLPSYCRDRILEVQVVANPELARAFILQKAEEKESIEKPAEPENLSTFITELRGIIADREEWPGQSACIEADPEVFHMSISRGQRLKDVEDLDTFRTHCSEALSFCNDCPNAEECLTVGITNQTHDAGPLVAGGHYINVNTGQLIDLLDKQEPSSP